MKTSPQATVLLWSNNESLKKSVEKYLKKHALNIVTKDEKETDYQILLITLNQHENLNLAALPPLANLKNYPGKVCLVLAGNSQNSNLSSQTKALSQDYLKDKSLNLRVVQTLDLYDGVSAQPVSDFHSRLCQAAFGKKFIANASGKNHYYPTAVSDLCQLTAKSLFVANTAGEIFTCLGEELTDLEVAYTLKKSLEKKDENLDLDLKGEVSAGEPAYWQLSIETQALLNWLPKTALTDAIDDLIGHCPQPTEGTTSSFVEEPAPAPVLRPLEARPSSPPRLPKFPFHLSALKKKLFHQPTAEKAPENLHQTEKKTLLRFFAGGIIGALILSLLPVFLSWAFLYFSTTGTYRAYQQIRIGESEKSRLSLDQAKFYLALAQAPFRTTAVVLSGLAPKTVENTGNFVSILTHGQEVLGSVLDTYDLGSQLYLGLIGKQAVDSSALTAALRVNLIALSEKLSEIQLLLGKIDLPLGYAGKIKEGDLSRQINLLKSQISLSLPLIDLLNTIAANQGNQRHLLVIQDPNELRPGGGFLTSIATLTLDQGKITNLQVEPALSLDRLIEGRIEPPARIKSLTGETKWLFHDSNLDANFSNSANQMAWFYERFKGGKLDGVIGFNLSFLKFILDEVGPQTLESGQTISADNLYELASNPTASQASDPVTALTRLLAAKFIAGDLKFASLARALLKTTAYNEITLWFRDARLSALAQDARLAGNLMPLTCHPQLAQTACRPDTIHLNEANFSVSKLNFYLKRKIDLQAEIKETNAVEYTLTVDYSYPVPAPTNLTQIYKAYYQFYLPAGSQGLQVALDNQPLDPATLIASSAPPLTKVEFFASQAVNQSHRLVITFTSPNRLDLSKPQTALNFFYLKQPGTLNDQLAFRVIYPEKLQPRIMTIPFKQVSARELTWQASPTANENIGLLFKNTSL